jgi:hypothetical protein
MIECAIQLLTPNRISGLEYGKLFVALLLKHFPDHAPQRYGTTEPPRKLVPGGDFYAALDLWGSDHVYIAKRDSPKALLHVSFEMPRPKSIHSSISFFEFQIMQMQQLESLDALVRELSQAFSADYAMAHILTRAELDDRLDQGLQRPSSWPEPSPDQIVARVRAQAEREAHALTLWRMEIAGVQTVYLRKCLPSLYWLNIFGPPYVKLFGKERLIATPGENVEVKLTNDLLDTPMAWEAFKQTRASCRKHLNSNVFCERGASKDHEYRTPEFCFPESSFTGLTS